MTFEEKTNLYDFLSDRLTPHKRDLFTKKASQRTNQICVFTENLREDHNASALLRTADAFGLNRVYALEEKHFFMVQPNISKRAEKWLQVTQVDEGDNRRKAILENIRKQGYAIWAAMPNENSVPVAQIPMDKPVAILLGNEVHGISEDLVAECDGTFTIPMRGYVESFNVSVSLGIILGVLDTVNDFSKYPLTEEEQLELKILWAARTLPGGEHIVNQYLKENGFTVNYSIES